ncbi:hypothetical protein Acr_17g0000730 [Actinidia rufa]|uniref:Uncharacterized protein n=1 Tax=Actinidia rufa TaxID=165716 RepID=A0A7J0G0P9_9ERIC|nr:hypothetical protein Acr_17g0000730 [Actinidia rufa]
MSLMTQSRSLKMESKIEGRGRLRERCLEWPRVSIVGEVARVATSKVHLLDEADDSRLPRAPRHGVGKVLDEMHVEKIVHELGEMDVASATVGDFDSALHILAGLKCALLEVRRAHLATQAEITEMRPRLNEVRRDLRKARATVVNLEA